MISCPQAPFHYFKIVNLVFKSILEEPPLYYLRARFCMRSDFCSISTTIVKVMSFHSNCEEAVGLQVSQPRAAGLQVSQPSDSDSWTLVSRKGRRSHNPTTKSVRLGQGQQPVGSDLKNSAPYTLNKSVRLGLGQQPAGSDLKNSAPLTIKSSNGQGQQPAGSVPCSSGQGQQPADSVYNVEFPPLPIKRGGWDVPRGGLFGGQPPRRNLFSGLKPEEIQAALEDSPTRGDPLELDPLELDPVPAATTSAAPSSSAGPPTPVPAATTSAAPSSPAGPPTPVPAATPSAAPSPSAAPPTGGPTTPTTPRQECSHCLQSVSQHKCSQCGLVRCTQFHLGFNAEGKRICQGCDPTVYGVLRSSTMWRMPGLKRKASSTPPTSPPPTTTSKRSKRVQWSSAESAISGGFSPSSGLAGLAGPSRSDR